MADASSARSNIARAYVLMSCGVAAGPGGALLPRGAHHRTPRQYQRLWGGVKFGAREAKSIYHR